MIVSHEHKFIFLKTKKTAGTSIELALYRALRARGRHHAVDRDRRGETRRAAGARRTGGCMAGGDRSGRCSSAAGSNSPPRITASTITCPRRRRASSSTTECGGAISNSPSTAIRGTGRSPSIITATATRKRRPPSQASCMRTPAPASTITTSIPSTATSRSTSSGAIESLADDLKLALGHVGLSLEAELPRAKTTFRRNTLPYRDYYDDDTRGIVARWYCARDRAARL